jgi:hypothetical protein
VGKPDIMRLTRDVRIALQDGQRRLWHDRDGDPNRQAYRHGPGGVVSDAHSWEIETVMSRRPEAQG